VYHRSGIAACNLQASMRQAKEAENPTLVMSQAGCRQCHCWHGAEDERTQQKDELKVANLPGGRWLAARHLLAAATRGAEPDPVLSVPTPPRASRGTVVAPKQTSSARARTRARETSRPSRWPPASTSSEITCPRRCGGPRAIARQRGGELGRGDGQEPRTGRHAAARPRLCDRTVGGRPPRA
jgi:hypothetical protein